MIVVNDNARIRNLLWVDARNVAAFEEFGDVVTFDTTSLTNKYCISFASFVGVNHHAIQFYLDVGYYRVRTPIPLFGCFVLG